MQKSTFHVKQMDCPAEEQLVRLALDAIEGIESLDFDLDARTLDVYHNSEVEPIEGKLQTLNLGATLEKSTPVKGVDAAAHEKETGVLLIVFFINLFFFILEIATGYIAGSMGLLADSLDMLADCIVFGLALFAVGRPEINKKRVAKQSGYLQLVLVVLGIVELLRHVFGEREPPEFGLMIGVAFMALIGNAVSLIILQKHRSTEAHVQAGVIFTSNDVVINIGVIVAGVAVLLTGSDIPDLIVGTIVFLIVGRGAFRILQLAK